MKSKFSIEKLEEIVEEPSLSPTLKEVIDIFLKAANDWPDETPTLEEYISQVKEAVGSEPTGNSMKEYNPDLNHEAWKAESVAELLELYKYYNKDTSLKNILFDLNEKLEK
jgi:hypothetical protein